MLLEGACHCGGVRFTVESAQPYPFNRCYCSICRKTAGGGGYAINLGADNATLKVEGQEYLTEYRPLMPDPETGERRPDPGRRYFCSRCGSALWLWDARWPELVHPLASAIDTPLPVPPEHTHLMLGSKAVWVEPDFGPHDRCFEVYPDESLAEWHARLGLTSFRG
ncbi:alanine acetyltransferase [Acidihalobacter yilgarnensis]|uniref:Alanine acetyltransferase n=1 Tax=Acidihalobacter yilgarnensis TaxID=2819280 RepID=A0A1D8IKW2_9GAMM|nr:GFA family protein [Acidihalobacter yilgarnensis]AOU97110.1 alanine acetyltransferase [Acidihalobacter yilgarnensis]